jgi:predicted DsbA family dithiol-disulfide isomerase
MHKIAGSAAMARHMKIDFVSDIMCPWCIIGLRGLEEALERIRDVATADITFRAFELNPNMPREGENMREHVGRKYGASPEQSAKSRTMIKARAASVGFTFASSDESRVWNTFDAHRLLHWAEKQGHQSELKHRLFVAVFTEQRDVSDRDVLVDCAADAGLDADEARTVLESGAYSDEVRAEEHYYRSRGINSVPSIILDDTYLITGGQTADAFEQTLRQIVAKELESAAN